MGIKCCDFRYRPNCVLVVGMVFAFGVWSQTGSLIERLCHCGLGTICCSNSPFPESNTGASLLPGINEPGISTI